MANNRGRDIDLCSNLCYNMDMEKVKLFSIEETAETLGISRSAVYNLINGGKLKAIKLDSRTMVRMADLTDFVESRERYEGCLNEI